MIYIYIQLYSFDTHFIRGNCIWHCYYWVVTIDFPTPSTKKMYSGLWWGVILCEDVSNINFPLRDCRFLRGLTSFDIENNWNNLLVCKLQRNCELDFQCKLVRSAWHIGIMITLFFYRGYMNLNWNNLLVYKLKGNCELDFQYKLDRLWYFGIYSCTTGYYSGCMEFNWNDLLVYKLQGIVNWSSNANWSDHDTLALWLHWFFTRVCCFQLE